jgi:6-phosphofructokinase 2
MQLKDEEAIVSAAANLIEMGVEIAAISWGKDGMIVANREVTLKLVPPAVNVDSAVGAGDASVAGLVLKLSSGANLVEAARMAVAAGTATALTPGTELCHRGDVERILPQVAVKKL